MKEIVSIYIPDENENFQEYVTTEEFSRRIGITLECLRQKMHRGEFCDEDFVKVGNGNRCIYFLKYPLGKPPVFHAKRGRPRKCREQNKG